METLAYTRETGTSLQGLHGYFSLEAGTHPIVVDGYAQVKIHVGSRLEGICEQGGIIVIAPGGYNWNAKVGKEVHQTGSITGDGVFIVTREGIFISPLQVHGMARDQKLVGPEEVNLVDPSAISVRGRSGLEAPEPRWIKIGTLDELPHVLERMSFDYPFTGDDTDGAYAGVRARVFGQLRADLSIAVEIIKQSTEVVHISTEP